MKWEASKIFLACRAHFGFYPQTTSVVVSEWGIGKSTLLLLSLSRFQLPCAACGILPKQGWNPHLMQWKAES